MSTAAQLTDWNQKQGKNVDLLGMNSLIGEVKFGAYCYAIRSQVVERKEYAFNDWIAKFCTVSRSKIYRAIKLYENKDFLKEQFGDDLAAGIAEAEKRIRDSSSVFCN